MAASIRRGRLIGGVTAVALLGTGYWLGQAAEKPLAAQTPQAKSTAPAQLPAAAASAASPLENDKRVVAYIYGNIPLTREALGEYLIQRYGRDRIQLFVNKRIIEHACAQRGIDATPAEVDAQIADDCKILTISSDDFKTQVLRRYGKTMYEWREDVVRPRLMLAKLCREKIQVDEADLKKMFENRYGKKVRAKIIIWPKNKDGSSERQAMKVYDEIRKDDAAFDRAARVQPDGALASREGLVEPIARWSMTGDNTVEDEAFKLQPGEVSKLIATPVGTVVIKCLGFVEPQTNVDFENVKPELVKEVVDKKLSLEIPKLMGLLQKEAAPVYVLQPARPDIAAAEEAAKNTLEQTSAIKKD
jgi:PPIC-type PPIASE domain